MEAGGGTTRKDGLVRKALGFARLRTRVRKGASFGFPSDGSHAPSGWRTVSSTQHGPLRSKGPYSACRLPVPPWQRPQRKEAYLANGGAPRSITATHYHVRVSHLFSPRAIDTRWKFQHTCSSAWNPLFLHGCQCSVFEPPCRYNHTDGRGFQRGELGVGERHRDITEG